MSFHGEPGHSYFANVLIALSSLPPLVIDSNPAQMSESIAINAFKGRKRKRNKKGHIDIEINYQDPALDTSTAPESPKVPVKKKNPKKVTPVPPRNNRTSTPKRKKNSKEAPSPTAVRNSQTSKATSPLQPIIGKACLRCREKKTKCNEAKPTCNQCRRGLWTCQYGVPDVKKRSRNGCTNCKARRRKCTEERPACAHCLRVDDDCEYAVY